MDASQQMGTDWVVDTSKCAGGNHHAGGQQWVVVDWPGITEKQQQQWHLGAGD